MTETERKYEKSQRYLATIIKYKKKSNFLKSNAKKIINEKDILKKQMAQYTLRIKLHKSTYMAKMN